VVTVAPIAADQLLLFLLQVGSLLLLALLLGAAARRVGMPAIVGELLAGVILGPSLLARLAPDVTGWLFPARPDQFHLLDVVGQIAVLLLVGVTGIQLDLGLIRRRGVAAARISVAGLVVPLALGIATGLLLPPSLLPHKGHHIVFALFIGVAMCVSAIPVIAKTLSDLNLLHRNVGQLSLTAGVIDDAVGWLLLSVVSALATTGLRAGNVALSVLSLLGVLVVAVTVGRPVVRLVMRLAQRSPEPGLPAAATVVLVLFAGAATHALKLEAVLGAFVCGILIGSCRGLDRARLAPLRTVVTYVLAPLFFATVGLRLDLTLLARPPVLAGAVIVLLVATVGKFTGAFAGAVTSRLNRWEALAIGAAMNSRGVVEIIVASVGVRIGVLSTESYTIVVLVAIATSLTAPPILRWSMSHVEHTAEERLRRATDEGHLRPPVAAGDHG
jgi:Kef-type K+ transport system membrane component KefB